jgi:hypothetical protein
MIEVVVLNTMRPLSTAPPKAGSEETFCTRRFWISDADDAPKISLPLIFIVFPFQGV